MLKKYGLWRGRWKPLDGASNLPTAAVANLYMALKLFTSVNYSFSFWYRIYSCFSSLMFKHTVVRATQKKFFTVDMLNFTALECDVSSGGAGGWWREGCERVPLGWHSNWGGCVCPRARLLAMLRGEGGDGPLPATNPICFSFLIQH